MNVLQTLPSVSPGEIGRRWFGRVVANCDCAELDVLDIELVVAHGAAAASGLADVSLTHNGDSLIMKFATRTARSYEAGDIIGATRNQAGRLIVDEASNDPTEGENPGGGGGSSEVWFDYTLTQHMRSAGDATGTVLGNPAKIVDTTNTFSDLRSGSTGRCRLLNAVADPPEYEIINAHRPWDLIEVIAAYDFDGGDDTVRMKAESLPQQLGTEPFDWPFVFDFDAGTGGSGQFGGDTFSIRNPLGRGGKADDRVWIRRGVRVTDASDDQSQRQEGQEWYIEDVITDNFARKVWATLTNANGGGYEFTVDRAIDGESPPTSGVDQALAKFVIQPEIVQWLPMTTPGFGAIDLPVVMTWDNRQGEYVVDAITYHPATRLIGRVTTEFAEDDDISLDMLEILEGDYNDLTAVTVKNIHGWYGARLAMVRAELNRQTGQWEAYQIDCES